MRKNFRTQNFKNKILDQDTFRVVETRSQNHLKYAFFIGIFFTISIILGIIW